MPDKKDPIEPTKSELEILQVLWKHGPSTVRLVNDTLNAESREVQYTSTLKLMQIMHEKGILLRDDSSMKHVYRPAIEEKRTKTQLLDRMAESLFEGSRASLVMQLLGSRKVSRKELEEIRAFLKKMDEGK